MVKSRLQFGKPAIGVWARVTPPVVIDETADIKRAVASILMSKTFDNGVICASEQSVIVVDDVEQVKERFETHGGYILKGKELKAVQDIILLNGGLNAKIVGRSA